MKKRTYRTLLCLLTAVTLLSGCEKMKTDDGYDKVLVVYSNGYNSLQSYLYSDILDLKTGWIPQKKDKQALLLISHLSKSSYDFTSETLPYLIRIYKDKKENVKMDTLAAYSSLMNLGDAASLKTILQKVKTDFPSKHYGMLLSSHASGWIPKGYYSYPEHYEKSSSSVGNRKAASALEPAYSDGAVPWREKEVWPDGPAVKSFSVTSRKQSNGEVLSYEMTIEELAAAIPFHLDYLLIDACLMGGIEVAYGLRNVTDMVVFSQAEVLAEGFDYQNLTAHLLGQETDDVVAIADDYYQQYAGKDDSTLRSATVSVVDCTKLDRITEVCTALFDKYRTQIASLDYRNVQRYYRSYHHWYYDLRDIIVKCGATSSELRSLDDALSRCIVYSAATEGFLENQGGFAINTFSGFSMYLPSHGSEYLNSHYRTLDWNKATKLVD